MPLKSKVRLPKNFWPKPHLSTLTRTCFSKACGKTRLDKDNWVIESCAFTMEVIRFYFLIRPGAELSLFVIRQKEESGCWFPPAQHCSKPAKQKSDPIWKIIFYNSNKYFFSELQLLILHLKRIIKRTVYVHMLNSNMNFKKVIYLQNYSRPPVDVSCYYTWKAVIWLPAAATWIGRFPDSHWSIPSYIAFHWLHLTSWHMSHDP